MLRKDLLDKTNTSRKVWADTAYRSKANEEFMEVNGFVSLVHRKKPKGKPMNEATRRANNLKSKIRSHVEHVFAEEKTRMGLFIRTIGMARAMTKIGLAQPCLQHQTPDLPGTEGGGVARRGQTGVAPRRSLAILRQMPASRHMPV